MNAPKAKDYGYNRVSERDPLALGWGVFYAWVCENEGKASERASDISRRARKLIVRREAVTR